MSLLEKMLKKQLKENVSEQFVIEMNMPKEYPPIPARKTEEGGVRDRFMAAKAELPDEVTVIRPFNVDAFKGSNENTIYVAENGCDCNCGCKEKPLATLEEALKRVEGKGGAKIVLRGGNYNLTKTVNIGSEHSGTIDSPLIITAEKGETPYISASQSIPYEVFKPISCPKMKARLKPEVQDKVLVANLPSVGITNYGELGERSPKLLIDNVAQIIARYPNADEELIVMSDKIYDKGGVTIHPNPGDRGFDAAWEIGITDPRCLEWEWNEDIWMYGALYAEWGRLHAPIGGFDREKMSMKGKHCFEWGVKYEPNNDYYFYNVFEELDVPGEWYIDRQTGDMYLYPVEGMSANSDIRFAVEAFPMIVCNGAENVIIDGLNIGRSFGSAVAVRDCTQVLVQRCHVIGTSGRGSAVGISGGFRNGVIASKFELFSSSAVNVTGGDRLNFIPSNNFCQNCIFFNPLTHQALSDGGGVGTVISHNYMDNCRMGSGGGNECIIEYNIIEGGDPIFTDSGMIYVGGGGCSACGNHYRYNYFFDFARLDYGIYFDDMSRGMYAYGNIIVGNGVNPNHEDINGKWWPSGGRTFNFHNGGEHVFYNNISIDAGFFAFGGDITYWLFEPNWNMLYNSMLDAAVDKRTDKYMGRNPTYKDFVEALDQYTEDRKDPNYVIKSGWAERRLRTPWYNHIENNLIFRADRPYKLDNGEEFTTGLDTNYVTNDDPGFVDLKNKDYRFTPNADVFKHIPDFVPPPFEKMGPVDDFAE